MVSSSTRAACGALALACALLLAGCGELRSKGARDAGPDSAEPMPVVDGGREASMPEPPEPDAGRDAAMPEPEPDAGRDAAMPEPEPDAGHDAAMPEPSCTTDGDCGDVRVFRCAEGACVPRRVPQATWVSSGGGSVRSSEYEARISIGVPAPMGRMQSARYAMTVGAGAGRP